MDEKKDRFFAVYISLGSAPVGPAATSSDIEWPLFEKSSDGPAYALHVHLRARDIHHAVERTRDLVRNGTIPRTSSALVRKLGYFDQLGVEYERISESNYDILVVRSRPYLALLVPGRFRMLELPMDIDTLARFYDLSIRDSEDVLAVAIVDTYDSSRTIIDNYSTRPWSMAKVMDSKSVKVDKVIHKGKEYPSWFRLVIEFGE